MRREYRYIVMKLKDAAEYLSELDGKQLDRILDKIAMGRMKDGKAPLECVVVEHDWPEYEPTWAAITSRVEAMASEAMAYKTGYTYYPKASIWPAGSPESTGWFDAEREYEQKQDDMRGRDDESDNA